MPILQDAFKTLRTKMKVLQGEPITYVFGDLSIEVANAVRGQTTFEDMDADGETRTETKSVDWIIYRDDLVDPVSKVFIEPERGATITDSNGDTYDIVPGSNQSGWRWLNSYKTGYRCYTARRSSSVQSSVGIGVMAIESSMVVNP